MITGFIFIRSAYEPIMTATIPIKNTYIMYRMVVASEPNVHFAFAKKEKVTATQNAIKLDSDCCNPCSTQIANVTQWISVLITPIDMYLAKSFSMAKFCKK